MRWRKGEMAWVDAIMVVLLSKDEADCLAPNIDRDAMTEDSVVLAAGYRGSGLVLGPEAAVAFALKRSYIGSSESFSSAAARIWRMTL
jgi:hypothetical protein